MIELPANFFDRITESDGHWLWQGSRTTAGYGNVTISQRQHYVHRLVYEYHAAEIPPGLELDHLCLVRHCCNPMHLEVVTHSENMRRIAQRRTACNAGHAYAEGSFIVRRGARECLICRRRRANAYWRMRRREARAAS